MINSAIRSSDMTRWRTFTRAFTLRWRGTVDAVLEVFMKDALLGESLTHRERK